MNRSERAFSDAFLHDLRDRPRQLGERGERLAVEVHAAFGHFPEHDGWKKRVLADERRDAGDRLVDFLRRQSVAACDKLQAFAGLGEGSAEESSI